MEAKKTRHVISIDLDDPGVQTAKEMVDLACMEANQAGHVKATTLGILLVMMGLQQLKGYGVPDDALVDLCEELVECVADPKEADGDEAR